jgi:putative hemolysin
MPVDEFAETLGLVLSADRKYQTVAGFLLEGFGSLPAVGDSFDAQGWRFEVLDLDGRRVDKIVASRTPPTRRAPQRKT